MTMTDTNHDYEPEHNPVDTVEEIATLNNWMFERPGQDEIAITVTGGFCNYQMSFSMMHDLEALHVACAFDLKVAGNRMPEVYRLLSLINEQLWVGHFDVWSADGLVMFRQSLLLSGGAEASDAQCERLMHIALENCEQYYQAFQYVIWAGKSAPEALAAVMFETVGHA